ncbi:RNA methyltransferase [Runella sp. SP2]|uniref:RNA methyltransferase n=1 Tax=Runella sp. SP2 TaxID=2268026 RepID=UPI000F07F1E2|nr:RNA methyltransferase [Runella sp. SP2]AYQ31098.1 RNA methyltransferase [Runella sp. SP2]
MLSKNVLKYLSSLQQKKYRQEYGAFLVEGAKSVLELLASDFEVEMVVATDKFYKENTRSLEKQPFRVEIATPDELVRAGTLQSNDAALAVVKTKSNDFLYAEEGEYVLVLDDIRDPGNLGTMIRIADWYGIRKMVCSLTTTDWYNPKVVAASKGSFTRVQGFYTDLGAYFEGRLASEVSVYGTFLEGKNIHQITFAKTGYIVMGNESNGIGSEVEKFVTDKITIPRFGEAESLNVGIATAIVLDNWRR